jgi:hypothetical protein
MVREARTETELRADVSKERLRLRAHNKAIPVL